MKNKSLHIVTALLATLLGAITPQKANAQDLLSAYFIDNYTYSYRINPAFQTKKNFAGALISTIHSGTNSNVGLSTFIYPYQDKLANFMHPSVSSEKFLGKLHKINRISIDVHHNIASVGFWSKYKGEEIFQTYEINWKNNTSAKIPYQVFKFLKGGSGEDFFYDLSNVRAFTRSYLEFAGGVSKREGKLSWGARGKFLLGMHKIDGHIKQMYADLNGLSWSMNSSATITAAGGGIKKSTRPSAKGEFEALNFNSLKFKPIGLGGAGAAIDIGLKYEINPYINLSLSANDLGVIFWKDKVTGKNDHTMWVFEGIDNIDNIGDIGHIVNDIIANFKGIYEFKEAKNRITGQTLATTINGGIGFRMPFYNKLTVGILGSVKFRKVNPYQEVRLSLNATPLKWLSASINTAYSTYGWEVGGMINICAKKFNLFMGTDSYYYNMNKQFIPINEFNTQVVFGVNYLFGTEH